MPDRCVKLLQTAADSPNSSGWDADLPSIALSGIGGALDGDTPITDDLLSKILVGLPTVDLACAAQVCQRWRSLALGPELHAERFRQKWGFQKVFGSPLRFSFWRLESPPFVVSHRLKSSDTVASVAVQYGCQILTIRRANNMMSDHAIYTRTRLLVPLSPDVIHSTALMTPQAAGGSGQGKPQQQQQEQARGHRKQPDFDGDNGHDVADTKTTVEQWLRGKHCRVEFDCFVKRDVGLVFAGLDEALCDEEGFDSGLNGPEKAKEAMKQDEAKRAAARSRIVQMLVKAFGVDEATAAFYLEEAGGDVRAASRELRSDLQWERTQRKGKGRR